jgi:hypothetical protein
MLELWRSRRGRRNGTVSPRAGGSPHLSLSCSLAPGRAWPAASAALARVLGSPPPPRVVILELTVAELDSDAGAALGWLRDRLRRAGSRLWLAAASGPAGQQLQQAGAAEWLGPDAVHRSLRAAVLAVYAALPGPGLVTADMRAALTTPAEPLRSEGPAPPAAEPVPAVEPLPAGQTAEPMPAGQAAEPVPAGQAAEPPRRLALSAPDASPPAGGAAPGR